MLSDLQIQKTFFKFAWRCQYKEVHWRNPLLCGLVDVHSSEGGTTIYTGCSIRKGKKKKKLMNGDGGDGIRGENFKITLSHSSVKEQTSLEL